MKRVKFFAAASTCVLVVAAVFASKANRRFTAPVTVFYNNGGSPVEIWGGTSTINDILTSTSNLNPALLSGSYQMVTAGPGYTELYLKAM